MSNNTLIVMCENEIRSYKGFEKFFKIGVERGCLDLIKYDQKIDLAISDFDNVVDEELGLIKSKATHFEILDPKKDLLDGEIAIQKAIELGSKKIIVVTKPTKRYDMNFSLISLVDKYDVVVSNTSTFIFKVKKGETTIPFAQYQDFTYMTFFPIRKTKLTLANFRYNAENLELEPYSLRAYSNSFYAFKDGKVNSSEDIICILSK